MNNEDFRPYESVIIEDFTFVDIIVVGGWRSLTKEQDFIFPLSLI